MSFIVFLESIRIHAQDEIKSSAENMFEDIITKVLNNYAKLGLSTGIIDISEEINSGCFNSLKQVLNCFDSECLLKWLIDVTRVKYLFDGVKLWLPLNNFNGIIHFSWLVSSIDLSITHSLKKILDENRSLITRKTIDEFNNGLRDAMKCAASKGLSKGDFIFYGSDELKRILNETDNETDKHVNKWLLDKIIKENDDLVGINIFLNPRYDHIINFKW